MSSAQNETSRCPTMPGLSTVGFYPGLEWDSVKANVSGSWHVYSWIVCAVLIFIIWIVSIIAVAKNLRNYYEPQIQRHKLRVLLFPPVYATLSWFAYLRYDYSTTINFFATLFEAFAVYNLFNTLQAYLQPFRLEAGNIKEPKDTKIIFMFKLHLNSMWGMHYSTITDILVFQYPVWELINSFVSIFTELKGRYCAGVYSFKGAYIYLTIIDFTSLTVILTVLFTYLDVFKREWLTGKVKAHGMFWCVKGPILVNFYFGELLLDVLTAAGVIKGTDGSDGSISWPADAVKNAIYILIVCVVMFVDSFMMLHYFGPADNIQNAGKTGQAKKTSAWKAFVDGYLAYIPEFLHTVLCCGFDSYKLTKKRIALKKRNNLGAALDGTSNNLSNNNFNPTDLLPDSNNKNNTPEYRMNELRGSNTAAPIQQYEHQSTMYQEPYQNNAYSQAGYPPQNVYDQPEIYSSPQQYHQSQHPF